MNPRDFLDVANRLHPSGDEADRRTSISRSYYAAYNVLVQTLAAKGVRFERNPKDHGRLVHYLAHSGDLRMQTIAGFLRTLRVRRGDADYDMRTLIKAWDSQLSCFAANNAITQFDAISGPDLDHIASVINALPPYVS